MWIAFKYHCVLHRCLICLDISPELRAHPRATQQGNTKCGGTSPCQQSYHGKKFRRKVDKKILGGGGGGLTTLLSHALSFRPFLQKQKLYIYRNLLLFHFLQFCSLRILRMCQKQVFNQPIETNLGRGGGGESSLSKRVPQV